MIIMSESNSVFIKTNLNLSEIKLCLEKILNCQLKKVENVDWEIYSISLIGLQISLLEAVDFDDDRELNFSEFSCYVDIDYIRNAFEIGYESDWRRMTSIVLGNMISRNLNCECLVVNDMQRLVERFLPKG